MDLKHKIIQLNCRGLKSNFNEILLLLSLLNPSIFCLQETFLKTNDNIDIKGVNIYNYIHSEGQRPSAGSSIFVKSCLPQREIKIKTQLQAVAVSVTLDKEITVCSVYISPAFTLTTEHLQSLLSQLPASYILVGDFNGHSILWGCKENNSRGDIIDNFITNNNLCLMNDKSYTYLHPATGKFSSLDLSICLPSVLLDFDWTVSEDQYGSDHFPVIIESVNNSTNDPNAEWKLNKANWELYHSLCAESLKIDKFDNSLDPLDDFTSLLDVTNKRIPTTSTNPKKSKPWYNDECKDAIKQPTKENLNNVKNLNNKGLQTQIMEILRFEFKS